MAVTSDWQTGYCADIHVHNGGDHDVQGWTVVLDAGSSSLTQAWNVQVARSASTYTVTPVGWNAPIGAGASLPREPKLTPSRKGVDSTDAGIASSTNSGEPGWVDGYTAKGRGV